jgi:hypothetical protein
MDSLEPYIKDKIGRHLSYPVKFHEVVSLLSPAVEQLKIKVWFSGYGAPRQNERRERYQIMEAAYASYFGETPWSLFIRTVPRQLRAAIRSAAIPAATDRIRAWFLERPRRLRPFRVYFCPARSCIEYEP